MAVLQSILVPVDGSAASLSALDHAIALAEDLGANVDVLHVEAPVRPVSGLSPSTHYRLDRAEMERVLVGAVDHGRDLLGDRITRRNEVGDPLRVIVNIAASGHYDLIVMGTHGRVGRLHSLLGSVAEGVVRNAACPVLTVREPGSEYQSFAERRHGRPTLAEQSVRPH